MESTKENEKENKSKNEISKIRTERYTFDEDMAIIKFITDNKRYLQTGGIRVWKEAVEKGICPGRPYQSLKERYRKVISRNLKQYNVDKELISTITQFMRTNKKGKSIIRLKAQ